MSEIHKSKHRIAYLLTHPIQYQSPLIRLIAAQPDMDIRVFYQSDVSVRAHHDEGFGRVISWDTPLLDGYEYEFLPAIGGRQRLGYWRPFNYGFVKRFKEGNFHALLVHGYNRPFHWFAIVAARMCGLKVLLRDESHLLSKKRSYLNLAIKKLFFRLLDPFIDTYFAIGSANKAYYEFHGIPKQKIVVMPYAVDNMFFRRHCSEASKKREEFRKIHNLEAGRPIVLYASKLQVRKRPVDLLDAFILASKELKAKPYLLFVGDGELREEVEDRVKRLRTDSVRLLGFKNQTELPAYYDLCDVFVLPSVHETWGLVINEAMNAGKALILSNEIGCATDLLRNGQNGYTFEPGDVPGLANALVKVLEDRNEARRMGEESLRMISKWSYEEDVHALRSAFERS